MAPACPPTLSMVSSPLHESPAFLRPEHQCISCQIGCHPRRPDQMCLSKQFRRCLGICIRHFQSTFLAKSGVTLVVLIKCACQNNFDVALVFAFVTSNPH